MQEILDQIKDSIQIKDIYDLFRNNKNNNSDIYHSNYFLIFIIEFILFGCFSLYLYHLSKYFRDNNESNIVFAPKGLHEKHELLLNFSKASLLRCLSIIYIVLFSNHINISYGESSLDTFLTTLFNDGLSLVITICLILVLIAQLIVNLFGLITIKFYTVFHIFILLIFI